jgi:hypothetical protein
VRQHEIVSDSDVQCNNACIDFAYAYMTQPKPQPSLNYSCKKQVQCSDRNVETNGARAYLRTVPSILACYMEYTFCRTVSRLTSQLSCLCFVEIQRPMDSSPYTCAQPTVPKRIPNAVLRNLSHPTNPRLFACLDDLEVSTLASLFLRFRAVYQSDAAHLSRVLHLLPGTS